MDSVQQTWVQDNWTQQAWAQQPQSQQAWARPATGAAASQPQYQQQRPYQRPYPRLAAALGVKRRTLEDVLERVQHDLGKLRDLTLSELKLLVNVADAERIFYLVQWERLQAHLELYGTLPQDELWPLLETLVPIFERHFNPTYGRSRLNEALIALYRAEFCGLEGEVCLNLKPPSPVDQFLRWLGF